MCQSLADGGIRCSAGAIRDIEKHTIAHVETVREAAANDGVHISRVTSLGDGDWDNISEKTDASPAVKKAKEKQVAAYQQLHDARRIAKTAKLAIVMGDNDIAAKTLAEANPDFAYDKNLSAEENKSKKKAILEQVQNEVKEIGKLDHESDEYEEKIRSLSGVYEARKNFEQSSNDFTETLGRTQDHYEALAVARNTAKSPEFVAYTQSESYAASPDIDDSLETQRKLNYDLKLTPEHNKLLERQKSRHDESSREWKKIDDDQQVLAQAKALRKFKNMAKVLPPNDPRRKAQWQEYKTISDAYTTRKKAEDLQETNALRAEINGLRAKLGVEPLESKPLPDLSHDDSLAALREKLLGTSASK